MVLHRIDDYKRKEKKVLCFPIYKEGENSIGSHCIATPDMYSSMPNTEELFRKKKWFFVNSRMCVCISREDTHIIQCNAGLQYYTWYQVWPLTQFYSVSFLWKIIDLPGGQINDPSSGKHYSLPFLPATPSSPSRTLEGLFELKRCPSRALNLYA